MVQRKKNSNKSCAKQAKNIQNKNDGPVSVDRCTSDYVSALVNPWDAEPACIPSMPSLPSETRKFIRRGTFTTGSADFGFIAMRPVLANDTMYPVLATRNTFGGTTLGDALITGVVGQQLVTPYAGSMFGTSNGAHDVKWRPVAYGIRVRYIGKAVDRGGRLITYRDQNNGDLLGLNFNELASRQGATSQPITGNKWSTVCYSPADPEEMQFSHQIQPAHLTGYGLTIACVAPRDTPLEMEFEVCMHVEIVGSKAYNVNMHFGDPNLASKAGDILVGIQRGILDNFENFKRVYKNYSPALLYVAKRMFSMSDQAKNTNLRIEL